MEAFTLEGDVDCLFYQTDAQPILDHNEPKKEVRNSSYDNKIDSDDNINQLNKDVMSDDSDDDVSTIHCDHLVKGTMPSDTGQFKVENSAVEVANSTGVRIGNSFNQKTDINFGRAKSVVVDQSQWYINCSNSTKIPFQRSTNQVIVNKVQEFNQDRYKNRLVYFTPLPWCTWFSPHLDNLYTALKLVTSDRFDGRADQSMVSLEQIVQDNQNEFSPTAGNRPCRVLIEGNPGFGKTTLTLKMASDWATKKEYLNKFHLVFLIPLRDFQGDLQSYLFTEFFPQHESAQDREDWWNFLKENQQSILFILDGLDELLPEHRAPIDMLLKGNIFDKVSVVVTSRSISSDHHILSFFNRRIEIRGFGLDQTEQFIQNYFQIKQKPQRGSELISLLNGPYSSSRHLASCPLTCLFLCVVYEDEGDHGILHKMTQIYQGLVSWLIRRASNKKRISVTDRSSPISPTSLYTPQDYEKALSDFGLLCLQVLARGGNQFTDEQLKELPNNSCELVLELGLVVRSNVSRNITLFVPKNPSYQLIHKTFMEYLAALYLSGCIEERFVSHFHTLQSGSISKESLYLIFKFTAGLLAENAATFFRLYQLSTFELPVITLFELLHESGATSENVRALSSMLDSEVVVVRSNQIELDGWAGLLAEPDCPIRSLKFVWADPPFNSAALDRFFTAFQINRSVICLVITAACGLAPDENDVVAMGAFTAQALKKTQLRHFSSHLVGDTWPRKVITAVISMLNYRYAASSLTSIKINTDVGTQQVIALSKGLQRSNVKSLVLSKLSCEPEGYRHIAQLLKSIQHLSLSLSLLKHLPSARVDKRYEEGSPEDLQILPNYFNAAARERAGMNVKEPVEFSKSVEMVSASADHRKEANFLLSVLSLLESNSHGNFKLQEGLKMSGFLAPNALGLLKPKEPVCQIDRHTSGFHWLFTALQEPDCQLTKLDLTGCCLELLDLNCLGQALRRSPSLKSLRLVKLKSFEEVHPILINSNLTWLDVSSGYITIDKECVIKLLCALSTATKLVKLSLAGWKFIVESNAILKVVDRFMTSSPLQEINLTGCRFQMGEQLPHPRPVGGSCLSIISQIAANQNNEQATRWNSGKFLDALRPRPPPTGHQSPNVSNSDNNILDDLELTFQSETSSNSEEVDYRVDSHGDKGQWPNLVKLSLTEAFASFEGTGKNDIEIISGPQLFILLDRLRNLRELSVSMKPEIPKNATPVIPVSPLNDVSTKQFFRAIQQRLGSKLERLCMSFCSIIWQRPSQTAGTIARCLLKCEKLVELELNFVKFCAAVDTSTTAQPKAHQQFHSVGQGEPIHWFVNSIIAGCPHLKELSLIGMSLTLTQAYNLGLQIRDRWKGDVLRIHIWRTSNDENQPIQIIFNLLHCLKNDNRFAADYIGGYRETVVIRRRKHLCGLVSRFRQIKIGIPNFMPFFCPTSRDLFHFRTSGNGNQSEVDETVSDNIEELCSSLPPGLRSLFGLTPFDYSIMLANFWYSNGT